MPTFLYVFGNNVYINTESLSHPGEYTLCFLLCIAVLILILLYKYKIYFRIVSYNWTISTSNLQARYTQKTLDSVPIPFTLFPPSIYTYFFHALVYPFFYFTYRYKYR